MFQSLRGVVLIAAMMLTCGVTFAAEPGTADAMVTPCRMGVGMQPHGPTDQFTYQNSGMCVGIIDGLSFRNPTLCIPSNVTNTQGVKVVLKYIEDRPERRNEDFKILALEALRQAWPCKN